MIAFTESAHNWLDSIEVVGLVLLAAWFWLSTRRLR
jgi:hypothetical protein